MEGGRSLSAKEKRQEQIKRWENSATDLECDTYTNPKVRVKFDDGAVFLAACSAGDLDEVKVLLENGADINFANVDGLTALHQACIDGNLEVVQFLVEHGSEIDQEDNEGWTPLHATASCGFMDIAKYLVEKGSNVGAVNSEAELAIDIAEEDDMIDYFQKEIDKQGIDVDAARDIERLVMLEDANTLLNTYQNGEKVKFCRHLKSGATPMHITAAKGYNDVLKILIKAGLDVNARDNDGWTPLHAASHWSQEVSAKILADKNADFKARSKLGQTPFDVADEDMLEYLEELEDQQKEHLKDLVIEPPPVTRNINPPSLTKGSTDIFETKELQNGESETKEDFARSLEFSSEGERISAPARVTPLPTPITDTKGSFGSHGKGITSKLTNDYAEDASSGRLAQRNRPASLHSTSEQPHQRPLAATNSEGGVKPVAATQPVQSVGRANKENDERTPTFARETNEDAVASWRTGVGKTDCFDDKSRPSFPSVKSPHGQKSSYMARFSEEKNDVKTARVAPILDISKTKSDIDSASTGTPSGYQRNTTFARRKLSVDDVPTITATDTTTDTTTSFKRSGLSEDANENATDETGAAAKIEDAERRRSHLQPVRDEEAEAQRRIRSRRERQTRRSTQGVTLDVVEEAMRTIGQMKQKHPSAEKPITSASSDSSKSRTDSSYSSLKPYDNGSQQTPSSSGQSVLYSGGSSTPVAALPSGYIPSNQRVKARDSTEPRAATLSIPSITVDASPEGDEDKDDNSTSTENGSSTAAQRKSAAQQRRRSRKERRSTGLPDLKPETENNGNEGEEEESSPKEDSVDFGKAERLRAKYDTSSSLSNRHGHRPAARNSDSDIPSRLAQSQAAGDDVSSYSPRSRIADAQNYKRLYEENKSENERLRSELADAQRKISELETRLEKTDETLTKRQTLENEKRERRALERKLANMEQEIQNSEKAEDLRIENGHLKAENNALQRIVEKLGGTVPDEETQTVTEKKQPADVKDDESASLLSAKVPTLKSGSAPNLRKLEEEAAVKLDGFEPRAHESPARISRSSSSSSLPSEDESLNMTRGSYTTGSYASQPRAYTGSPRYLSSRYRDGTADLATSAYSTGSSYSSPRNRARLEMSSSPSSFVRTTSPRRAPTSFGSATDYSRTSTFAPSRYTSSGKDLSGYSGSSSSVTRRDYLKPLSLSKSSASSSNRTGSSTYRTIPSAYSMTSPSKTSYSSTSRPRHGYSSPTGRTSMSSVSPSKLSTSLSKYSSGLSLSRRSKKY